MLNPAEAAALLTAAVGLITRTKHHFRLQILFSAKLGLMKASVIDKLLACDRVQTRLS